MFKKTISRREMLKLTGMAVAGTILASCAPQTTAQPQPTSTTASAAQATATPVAKAASGEVVVLWQPSEFKTDYVTQFQTDHPSITITSVDSSDITKFFAMIAAGTPPDIVRCQAPDIPGYLARNLLKDLTPYFAASTALKADDMMPANDYYKAKSPLEIGSGNIYGMCKDFSPDFTVFAANKPFADAGVPMPDPTKALSYADIADLAAKVTKKEGDRISMWGYGYESGWIDRIWMNNLAELNQSLFSSDYKAIVLSSNPEVVKILKYYYDLAQQNLTANPLNPSPNGWNGTDFTAGILGMMQYGFWYTGDILSNNDTLQSQAVMLPGPTWAGVPRDPTMTATGGVIEADAKNPDAAWLVYEYFMSGQPAIDRAQSGWGVPALKSLMNQIPQQNDFQKQCYQVLQSELNLNTPPLQFNPYLGGADVETSWAKFLEQALRGTITFDAMVTNIETEVNGLIADNVTKIG